MKRAAALLVSLFLGGFAFGELAPGSVPPAIYPAPFQAGESLVFAIRWGVITAGYSTLAVGKPELLGGATAYHIVSEAHSSGIVDAFYHVEDRNEAWLDATWPRSLRYEKRLHEGKYRVHQTVELDQERHSFVKEEERLDKKTRERQQGPIPPDVLDVLSSLYYVRTLPLAVGLSYTMDVHSGDKTWPLVVRVTQRERVKVKAGQFDCFRLEPLLREPGIFIPKGRKLEVWVTADERRLPVLMRSEIFIGHISAELVADRTAPAALSSGL